MGTYVDVQDMFKTWTQHSYILDAVKKAHNGNFAGIPGPFYATLLGVVICLALVCIQRRLAIKGHSSWLRLPWSSLRRSDSIPPSADKQIKAVDRKPGSQS